MLSSARTGMTVPVAVFTGVEMLLGDCDAQRLSI
jgi:hypothetical protein